MLLWLLLPSLRFAPISLDDYRHLHSLQHESLESVWRRDPFGHFRPLKNLLFWLIARDIASLESWRAVILGTSLCTVALVQAFSSRLAQSRWLGLAVAMLWGLHPTTATAVCWLSTSNIAVSVLALLVYVGLAECGHAFGASRMRRRMLTALSLGALSFSLLSHEFGYLGPALYVVGTRLLRRPRLSPAVLIGSCSIGALGLVTRLLIVAGGAAYRASGDAPSAMIMSAARHFGENALLWLWPFGSFGVLLHDSQHDQWLTDALAWSALLFATALFSRVWRRSPALTLGVTVFTLPLLLVSNVVPLGNTPVAVHYLYLPGIGLSLATVIIIATVARRISRENRRLQRLIASTAIAMLAAAELIEARAVVAAWADEETLFGVTLRNYPDNVEAAVNLSAIYLRRGELERAAELLKQADRLDPGNSLVLRNRLSLLFTRGRYQDALEALDSRPTLDSEPELLISKGEALRHLQRYPDAALAFEKAYASLSPTTQAELRFHAAYSWIGVLFQAQRGREARDLLDQLLAEYPEREELKRIERLLR